jgi:hypothetical protein
MPRYRQQIAAIRSVFTCGLTGTRFQYPRSDMSSMEVTRARCDIVSQYSEDRSRRIHPGQSGNVAEMEVSNEMDIPRAGAAL